MRSEVTVHSVNLPRSTTNIIIIKDTTMVITSNALPLHQFTITQVAYGTNMDDYVLTAAYFVEDGTYTVFKDSTHAAVEAFRTDTVLRITRGSAADVIRP